MPSRRHRFPARLLPLVLALAAGAAPADSGVGVDTWRANPLHPDAGTSTQGCDPRGLSWLTPAPKHSPGGHLYNCPPPAPAPDEHGNWRYFGVLELGALGLGGDRGNALYNRYVDWDSGLILGLLAFNADREDGSYLRVRGSRLGDDNAYYQAMFGRAGAWKVQAFLRHAPNVLSHNARSIWDGVGSNRLVLAGGLVPAASTPAEVAAVAAAQPGQRLSVRREKYGLGFDLWLSPGWTAYAHASHEQRKGARPFGGAFFFNFPFPDNGGILETPRPIHDSTMNLNAGLRHAGRHWRLDLGYSGSFFRNEFNRYTYGMPFALSAVVPGAVSAPLTTGQFAYEPENDYHNVRATLTRKLPMQGQLSLTASGGRMSQDAPLIAPIDCQGVFGIGLDGSLEPGPANPFLFPCSQWNTPAALPRRSADLRINTALFDGRFTLRPSTSWTVQGGIRWNRDDYQGTWLAHNPLNGLYGYIAENGAQGSVVPGEAGIPPAMVARVRNLPLDLETSEARFGADWRFSRHDTLGALLTWTRREPAHRERDRVDTTRLKLTWANRAIDGLTVRANYTWLDQTGDPYNHDPYGFTFSSSLPGMGVPPGEEGAHTVEAMRKYDLSSRTGHKLDLMTTWAARPDMSLSASLRGDWNRYDAVIGRQDYDTWSFTLQWDWQPRPTTRASAFYGHDRSRLRMANVNDVEIGPDPQLGGPTYPFEARWWARDRQRNHNAGASVRHAMRRVELDASWNWIQARGITHYRFASPAALAYPDVADTTPGRFPPLDYRVNALTIGLTFALAERLSLRVFDHYERATARDWHWDGIEGGTVIDHRVHTDGGPRGWSANLVGVLLRVAL